MAPGHTQLMWFPSCNRWHRVCGHVRPARNSFTNPCHFFLWVLLEGGAWGSIVVKALRTVPGSIPGGVTLDFFRGSFRQNHVPWGRLSLWKWVPGIALGVKAAGAFGWRPTTLVVPKVVMIRDLNLPGTPRATSACRGIHLLFRS